MMISHKMKKFDCYTLALGIVISVFFVNPANAFTNNTNNEESLHAQLSTLTQKYGGRLGIYAINTADGNTFSYNATQRSPYAVHQKL